MNYRQSSLELTPIISLWDAKKSPKLARISWVQSTYTMLYEPEHPSKIAAPRLVQNAAVGHKSDRIRVVVKKMLALSCTRTSQ